MDKLTSINEQLEGYQTLNEVLFLQTFHERDQIYNSISQQNEESIKVSPLNFSKKVSVDALAKIFQTMVV